MVGGSPKVIIYPIICGMICHTKQVILLTIYQTVHLQFKFKEIYYRNNNAHIYC